MASSSIPVPLLAPLVALFALVPERAEACDPSSCNSESYLRGLSPVNATTIPIDGVLVLQWTGHNLTHDGLIAGLGLEVTENGQPVAGAFENPQIGGVLVWRPTAPFKPGAAHQVTGGFVNPDDLADYCADHEFLLDFEFLADMDPSEPLVAPEVTAAESVELEDEPTLETLLCCDGAFPEETSAMCGYDDEPYVFWNDGECAPTMGRGFLSVTLNAPTKVAAPTAALVVTTLRVDGEVVRTGLSPKVAHRTDAPFCSEVEHRNLATGETVTSAKQCHGDGVATQLGPQKLDTTAILAEACAEPPYVCEVTEPPDQPRWDPNKCMAPVPEQETETGTPTTSDSDGLTTSDSDTSSSDTAGETIDKKGCACTTDPAAPTDPTALLALLGLGLLRPRRPARNTR